MERVGTAKVVGKLGAVVLEIVPVDFGRGGTRGRRCGPRLRWGYGGRRGDVESVANDVLVGARLHPLFFDPVASIAKRLFLGNG